MRSTANDMTGVMIGMHARSALAAMLVTGLLAGFAGGLAAQAASAPRMFAAQTGPDQVTLAWDSVPGANEYRIYLADPNTPAPPTAQTRATITFSASGRRAIIQGRHRVRHGAYLMALDRGGQVLYQGAFNAVANAPLAPVTPPSAVQAQETGATEVTVSWSPVQGATAYMIGRAAGGSGLHMVCDLCPPTGQFVDSSAIPGVEHRYTVQAIFPTGISARIPSNPLTVGAAQLAAAAASKPMASGTPVTGTPASSGGGAGTTAGTGSTATPPSGGGVPGPTTGPVTTPTSGSGTPGSGQPTTWTPPGTPAGTGGTTTPPGAGTPTTPGSGAGGATSPALLPPTQANATVNGVPAGAAWVTWGPSPSSGVTGYILYHSINGGGFSPVQSLGNNAFGTRDTAFTPAQFAAGPLSVSYRVIAAGAGGVTSSPSNTTYAVTIQPPAAGPAQMPAGGSTTVHTSSPVTPPGPACKLDYQRADNMWAAFGRPDGNLGTESISLLNAQARVFVTDWAYEKQRNDGTNYYGSHLRVATNTGSGVVQLRVNNPATALFGGITAKVAQRLGATIGWLIMQPGDRAQFRDDLKEVHCGP